MAKRWMSRAAVAGGAAVALTVGSVGSAQAADRTISLTRSGNQVGTMTHLDADPDRIRVCDTRADGYGVTGTLWVLHGAAGWVTIAVVDDGGDAGCDTKEVPISGSAYYTMELCWNGASGHCVGTKPFQE
ncbi:MULTISPECIES: hypothetical protein [unclassified Streptomyces]|uniref:hypothetical protein n=1 Tax=unclassified Streptomyces TaxID=2593676 RepID=UPI001587531F|nr:MULTISPECIES: hypothetical protein [unclassified Streptomyces]NUV69869.1 hypothetical protein [Streptomyces sp. CAI-121]NUW03020.1 hypothetical protein [Streptomyces sp. CAI 127]NUW16359.1 hypothetical protein [Streptomyces sp. CAI-68]